MRHALILLVLCHFGLPMVVAQESGPVGKVRSTIVEVQLLTGVDGGALHAQEWVPIFENFGVGLHVRRSVLNDKPAVTEKVVGTLRYVTVVGDLERGGQIRVPGKRFSRSELPQLKEWLDELKTYGAQGSPLGQPLWGLTKLQFEGVYAELATVPEANTNGEPLKTAVRQIHGTMKTPLRWTTTAERALPAELPPVRQEVAGFSRGTSLAIVLNDFGLGFRPNRTPDGAIELVIEPLGEEKAAHWPVGWPLQQQVFQALPGMFVMTNVELDSVPLSDVLAAAEEVTQTPLFLDTTALARRKIDLNVKVSYPLKKTTWSLAFRALLVPKQMTREYWQDEAGRGFVWITTTGKERAAAVKDVGGKEQNVP